jgi:hypothetical protein
MTALPQFLDRPWIEDPVTGVRVPVPAGVWTRDSRDAVLTGLADFCAGVLRVKGYLDGDTLERLGAEYRLRLAARVDGAAAEDFPGFVAETLERERGLSALEELGRMGRVVQAARFDRMVRWTFGRLPGLRPGELYEIAPSVRALCRLLRCPASYAGDDHSLIHVTSANPAAAHLAAFWLRAEIERQADGEAPFVFAFVVDPDDWHSRCQQHFPEDVHEL